MSVHILVGVLLIHRAEDKDGSFSVFDYMTGNPSFSGFESLVGKVVKTESTGVERGSLFSVTDPKGDVV